MNKYLNVVLSIVVILCVAYIYSYAAPIVGANRSDEYFRNLGFAMGAGVFFMPVTYLLRKVFPKIFKDASISGFRFYVLSTVLASILFVPIRIDQVKDENQLYYGAKILAEPYGALYGACLGIAYLNEKCTGQLDESQFGPAPDCKALLPAGVSASIRTKFDESIASPEVKEMVRADVYNSVDILLAQTNDPKEACLQSRVKLDVFYKITNNKFEDAMARFRAAAYH